MRNFGRALRLTLRHPWTVAASVISALMVAVLWGGNIAALYPIVEIVFRNQSLSEWVDEEIETAQKASTQFETKIASSEVELASAQGEAKEQIQRDIARHQLRLEAEQKALVRYQSLQPYMHRFTPASPFRTLVLVIGMLLLGTLLKDFFLVTSDLIVARLGQLTIRDLRKETFRQILRLDLGSLGEKTQGDLISRCTGNVGSVGSGISVFYGTAFREPLKLIVCLIWAAWICWPLLVLTLIVTPLLIYVMRRLAMSIKRATRRIMEEMAQFMTILSDTFSGIKIVKAFTMERYERRRYRFVLNNLFRKSMRIARYNALVRPFTELMGIIMIGMAILVGGYLVLNQQTELMGIGIRISPTALLLFYAMLAGVADPARKLAGIFTNLQTAVVASDRVYEIIDRRPRVSDPAIPVDLPRHHRDLVFQGVRFSYHPDQPVLEDIDLTIRFGETIAIVGPNGCGKSTLVNMILRFYDPKQGVIRLDGIDLRHVKQRHLRRQIGLVTQETSLLNDTVLNNIRYGEPHANPDRVIEVARQAHAHQFITDQLDDGYNTLVGPGGNRLSGGQRQRIALARAILRDPSILILDEATSQIDLQSEQLIQKTLEQFIRNRTTIIISHRMSILALADRIVVMEKGKILDVGTIEELLQRCDLFKRLYQIEFRKSA